MNWRLLIVGLIAFLGCNSTAELPSSYISDSLKIEQLTEHTYRHISYLDIPNYGPFPCNGMIVVNGGEAMIFDTPTTDSVAVELINWVENKLNATVTGVVVNHFHVDCLGGLAAFHDKGIPSYASNRTIELATKDSVTIPTVGFETEKELTIGNINVLNKFYGEAHTSDNIVSYVPQDNVLFGGCMVKSDGAGKGNLADATEEEWSNTVERIKLANPEVEVVIPGHGEVGGIGLLDYTISKFQSQE